jgi:hypothetical protein
MSFVPAPQQANAAASNNNAVVTTAAAAPAAAEISDQELLFKMRTFDVFWVEKSSLMYRDGIAKVSRIYRMLSSEFESTLKREGKLCRLIRLYAVAVYELSPNFDLLALEC